MSNFTLPKLTNMADFNLPKMPEFKATKSGYEIRAEILKLAENFVTQDYNSKYQGWEVSSKRDTKSGDLITSVTMPEFPGLDKILETAEKMYAFVNQAKK
jgi:hypothetical protein